MAKWKQIIRENKGLLCKGNEDYKERCKIAEELTSGTKNQAIKRITKLMLQFLMEQEIYKRNKNAAMEGLNRCRRLWLDMTLDDLLK